ncbi:hypothetical protein AB0L40_10970 [Patulibacter sp. NPDC049589]|uniref:hypothetical protein n=1 Tax=Patulibacter sp. NPDC049589 TaxID=3154731 RepID=UPI00341F8B6A
MTAVLVAGPSLALPAFASAAPIGDPAVWKVTPEHAVVAGVPVRVHLQGDATGTAPADPDADTDPAAGLAIVPPGVACAPSYAEVVGATFQDAWHWTRGDAAAQPFDQQPAVTFDTPGVYTGCGYFGLEGFLSLEDDPAATTIQYQPRPIEVARPTVAVDLAFDGPPKGGGTIRLVGSASANAPETVTVQLNRDADACGSTAAINAPQDRFGEKPEPFALYGGPRPVAVAVGLPAEGGAHHLCVYASRDGQDGDPDLVRSGPSITIEAAPPAPPAPPAAPPADGTTAPPVQVLPPAVAPIDTSILTPVVTGRPRMACTLGTVAVRQGTSVKIRCPKGTGTIGVRLRKAGSPRASIRTSTLRIHLSRAELRTTRLSPGTWSSVVTYHGRPAGTITLVVLPPRAKAPRTTAKAARAVPPNSPSRPSKQASR